MNKEYLEFEIEEEGVSFFIQPVEIKGLSREAGIFQEASSEKEGEEKSFSSFSKALGPIRYIANSFVETMKMLSSQPEEVVFEASVAFTHGGNLVFLKSDVATTFKVIIKWKKENEANTKNP
ncbi:MAG: hypothetical protein J5I98_05950 [Phaeodactylibacter sp.]|nr:hypothetical protein [Phaeodactylibacter sp.]